MSKELFEAKSEEMRLQAQTYQVAAKIARLEGDKERMEFYITLKNQYHSFADGYAQTAADYDDQG